MNSNTNIMSDEILQVRSDRLFHDLFNENDMDTIEWVAMQILECSYEEIHGKVRVGNVRLTNTFQSEQCKYVDLIIEHDNEKIVVELNNNFNGNYLRNIFYSFNVALNSVNIGENRYDFGDKKVRIILVNLNWHRKKKNNFLGRREVLLEYPDEYNNDDYLLKIINVNLDYFDKIEYTKVSYRDRLWKLLTIRDKKELDLLVGQEQLLRDYQRKLVNLSKNDEYKEGLMDYNIERNLENQRLYLTGLRDGEDKGYVMGVNEGYEQGSDSREEEIVLNMYNKNLSFEQISDFTNLSISKIKEIIEKNK